MELRVFLVEDSGSMRAQLERIFASVGGLRIVATAVTESQARHWLQDPGHAWDLAVIDLVLEQGSGLGVIRAARERAPGRRIVVFSAYATPEMRAHCLKLGADAAFDKSGTQPFVAWLEDLKASPGN